MPSVAFNYQGFIARFPEFSQASPGQLQAIFDGDTSLYLENDNCSVTTDLNRRSVLLNLLTAHIAHLSGLSGGDGSDGPLPVGRMTSATEGSVSTSFSFTAQPGSEEWYSLSPYGLMYWQATAQYRQMLYVPEPTNFLGNNRQRGLSSPDRFFDRFR